jgi:hypothetical protein
MLSPWAQDAKDKPNLEARRWRLLIRNRYRHLSSPLAILSTMTARMSAFLIERQ